MISAETLRECEVDVGILPYPKYDEAQENYISQDWGGLMSVPNSISDPDMVGATMELLAWESSNEVLPSYYDITLSGKLSRDEDSRNMLELLPIIGAVLNMITVFVRDEQRTRKFLLSNALVWCVYTAVIMSTTFFAEFLAAVSTCIALYKYRQRKTAS